MKSRERWDPKEPLQFEIGRKGGVKVGEGNHRLALAKELGISKVPVWFHYMSYKVTKSRPSREPVEDVSPKAVKRVIEKAEKSRKPPTPEEQEQLDRLMKLIFGR